jgi:hypothetical protein
VADVWIAFASVLLILSVGSNLFVSVVVAPLVQRKYKDGVPVNASKEEWFSLYYSNCPQWARSRPWLARLLFVGDFWFFFLFSVTLLVLFVASGAKWYMVAGSVPALFVLYMAENMIGAIVSRNIKT